MLTVSLVIDHTVATISAPPKPPPPNTSKRQTYIDPKPSTPTSPPPTYRKSSADHASLCQPIAESLLTSGVHADAESKAPDAASVSADTVEDEQVSPKSPTKPINSTEDGKLDNHAVESEGDDWWWLVVGCLLNVLSTVYGSYTV